ncbi:MAG: hypothetical protein K8S54_09865 [Spirochaetia bacterium]|nr:hypothetical protein [Spirochaetia bacterium]
MRKWLKAPVRGWVCPGLIVLVLCSCQKPVEDPVPLVFIHGIKGSALGDDQGKRHWLTIGQALGLSKSRISLPTEWNGEEQARDSLKATEALDGVYLIPGLVGEKIYGPFLKAARKMDRPVYVFAYDWRRDNLENLKLFINFLKETSAANGNKKIQVVAHSMGGLITRAALADSPELFQSVIFAGVPFHGGVGFLPDVHAGEPVALNKTILSPEVYFTFPSVYTLFPVEGSRVYDGDKELPLDFYDADDWGKYKLGLFALELVSPAQAQHLRLSLKHAKEFRRLVSRPVKTDVPIYVVLSKHVPTLASVLRGGPKSLRGYDFETRPREPGDGRVLERDAIPPDLKHTILVSDEIHSDLLNDSRVQDLVREAGIKP